MRVNQNVKVPILTYHSIDKSGSVVSTAPEVFSQQMGFLSDSGYTALSVADLLDLLSGEDSVPERTVVLTFDDGFQNFYSEAFPVLEKYGFRATVFLVTDHCGGQNDWAGNPADLPLLEMLGWDQVRELSESGIEFGAHTRTHPDLTRSSPTEVENEIVGSKEQIRAETGIQTSTFAYPYGRFNSAVKRVVERAFRAACSTDLGKARTGSDYFALERIDTYYLSNPAVMKMMPTNTLDRYLAVRRVFRNFRSGLRRAWAAGVTE